MTKDDITDRSERFLAAEILRRKDIPLHRRRIALLDQRGDRAIQDGGQAARIMPR